MRDLLVLAISLGVPALLALAIWRLVRGPRTLRGIRAEPDRPRGFGYKTTWLAVRCDDPALVVEALRTTEPRFRDATPCNWEHGFARVFGAAASGATFVTPAILGWVLVVGYTPARHPATTARGEGRAALAALEVLAEALGRPTYFFGSHRGVSYVDWVALEPGRITRAYAHADGTTYYDVGEPTADEKALDLAFHDELERAGEDEEDAVGERLPDEATVIELASRWTLDPRELEAIEEPSSGTLVRLG